MKEFYDYFDIYPNSTLFVKRDNIYEIEVKYPRKLRKGYQYIDFTGDPYLNSIYRLLNIVDTDADEDFSLRNPFIDLKTDKDSFHLASPSSFFV
jgi:hypothetical protein